MANLPTVAQLRVLGLIASAVEHQGFPPTVNELRQALELKVTRAVFQHLAALERHGLITRVYALSRSLRITQKGYSALGITQAAKPKAGGRYVRVSVGVTCMKCNALRFNDAAPCPMCALASRKVA